jgi:hypothetical protein
MEKQQEDKAKRAAINFVRLRFTLPGLGSAGNLPCRFEKRITRLLNNAQSEVQRRLLDNPAWWGYNPTARDVRSKSLT